MVRIKGWVGSPEGVGEIPYKSDGGACRKTKMKLPRGTNASLKLKLTPKHITVFFVNFFWHSPKRYLKKGKYSAFPIPNILTETEIYSLHS